MDFEQETQNPVIRESGLETGSDAPLHIRLDPDNPNGLHSKLLSSLQDIIRDADKHIRQRYDDWDEVDKYNRLYLDLSAPATRGDKSKDYDKKEMPFKGQVAVPLIYHIIQTRLAHNHSVLSSTDPFAHLESYSSDGFRKSRLMEARLNKDCRDSRIDQHVWQALYDVERYGICMWKLGWREEYEIVPAWQVYDPQEIVMRGIDPEEPIEQVRTQGNRIETVDPRNMILDPAVPSAQWYNMEYIGDVAYVSWLELDSARMERKQGPYINVDAARKLATRDHNRRKDDGRWMEGTYGYKSTDQYPLLEMANIQWRLIPSEFGLSHATEQEIWQFSVVNEDVIVRAHRLEQAGGKQFTYFTAHGDLDMHSPWVPSTGQLLLGLQRFDNWIINSHVANTKKTVNDQMVINDDLINKSDLANPSPGRMIRLTREGKILHKTGRLGINQMYAQLNMTNVTAQHLDTHTMIVQTAQRLAATPDSVAGMPLPTKRTLGEIENLSNAAQLRIGTTAQLVDGQLIGPAMIAAVDNIKEFADVEQMVMLTGRLVEQLGGNMGMGAPFEAIRGMDLQGEYEYMIRTPTMAKDPARQAATWGNIMQVLSTAPQLMNPMPDGRALNPHAIFNELVRALGVDYFDQFYFQTRPAQPPIVAGSTQAQVMGPEQIQAGVQAGNLVPMGGA
ncbi:MAG TPA: hypothetical protein VMW79_07820 [Anaerolineae bacterium]|nr:hypothetical protein [Anaerolineae bacterium]